MATNTTATTQTHNGNGSTATFAISFPFLADNEIDVTVGGVLKTLGTHYTIASSQITFTSGNIPPSGSNNIKLSRDTDISAKKVDFADGSVLTEKDLDNNSDQILFAQQEFITDYVRRDGSQTITGNLVFEGPTDDDNETTLAITDPTADRTITVPDITGTLVTTGDTGTVTSTMITDGTIVNGDIANNTITGNKLVNDTITSTQIGPNAVTASELADNSVDTNAVQDDAITYSKIQNVSATDRILGRDSAGAGVVEEITPANVRTMINVEDGADVTDATNVNAAGAVMNSDTSTTPMQFVIDEDDFASNSDTKIPTQQSSKNYIASVAQPLDNELTTLAGMQSGTASKLADSTALTADIADLNQLDGLTKQTTISDTDASFPTSGAVVDFVAAQIAPIGGLEVIPNDQAFPNTQPQSGVVISIADAGGLVVTPSGVSTTGRTLDGSTVTINNINSAFNNSTVDNGVAFMVSSTGSGQVYNFHKATLKEADILALSGDINDFAERYRVGASNPTASLDQGDLFFNTSNQKLFVYNGTIWDEVQSVGNFHISGFNESIDGSRQDFTINNAPANAQQVLLSINGVVQKPNSGNSTPSEGFALNGNIIKLASPPPSGSSVFVTVMGSTVDIGTPSDNTVTSAILQNGSVQTAKIADQAVTLDKLLHGDTNSDGKFLRANNGADPTFETIDLTNLSGSNLTSGTIPAARFGTDTIATGSLAAGALPTDVTIVDANISGNLTIESADIVNGTIVDADISGSAAIALSKLATGALPTGITVTSANISDLSIVNADINASAAIALSKLATGALPTGITIASANLVDGTIVNADINASAAIANSKLADSGVSAGTVGSSTAIPILTVNAKGIITATSTTAIDSTTIANGSSNVSVANNGAITSNANHDFSAGIDVTGNITVTGTVDGVDIATRDTLFSGLTSSSGVLSNGVAATTQGASDNTTKVATTAYVTTAINNLINGAPSALDTLNELAAAMNDDAAFSTTVTNSLATKMPLAGGQFTGNITFSGSQTVDGRDLSVDGAKLDGIEAGATGDQTNAEIRAAVEAASDSNVFTDADHSKLNGIEASATADQTAAEIRALVNSATDSNVFTNALLSKLNGIEASATADQTAAEIKTLLQSNSITVNEISNSAITTDKLNNSAVTTDKLNNNAVTLAKLQQIGSPSFLGRNSSGTGQVQNLSVSDVRTMLNIEDGATGDQTAAEIRVLVNAAVDSNVFTNALKNKLDAIAANATNVTNNNQLTNGAGYITAAQAASGNATTLDNLDSTQFLRSDANDTFTGTLTWSGTSGHTPLNFSASDGYPSFRVIQNSTSSGNYADGMYIGYANANSGRTRIYGGGATSGGLDVRGSGVNDVKINGYTVWHAGNDGSGSGLDADTLDGLQPSTGTTGNTIVQRTSGGYIFANYFNTSPNTVTSGVTQICVETGNDGYIRHGTAAAVRTFLNVADGATNNGSGSLSSYMPLSGGTFSGDVTFNGGASAVYIQGGSDIRLESGNWTGNAYAKIQHHSNRLYIAGGSSSDYSITLRYSGSDRIYMKSNGTLYPASNASSDLGTSSKRWNNLYVNDLQLSNENTGGNSVDGTWGDWTLQEAEDTIYMLNNRNGKKYKMNLTEV